VELLVARCAGLDVANHEVVACVRVPDGHGGRAQQVRTLHRFTSGLEALAYLACWDVHRAKLFGRLEPTTGSPHLVGWSSR
jgi:hypothetical protein